MTDTTAPIQIPGIDDYSFVLPSSTEKFLPVSSTVTFADGDSVRTVALTDNSVAIWRDAVPASTPGRVVNAVADALSVGWVVSVEYGQRYISAVLTPTAEAFAAHLWLLAETERSRDSRWGSNSRSHFAIRLGWSRESDGWRFDQAWSTTCRIIADAEDGTIDVRWPWDVRYRTSDQHNLRDLRGWSQSCAPSTVVAGQADKAVALVQAAADDEAYAAAKAEYEATGRFQFDGLRDALTEFVDGAKTTADQRLARAGEQFAKRNDERADDLRTEAAGIRWAAQYAQGCIDNEGDRLGTGVSTLADLFGDTLTLFVDTAVNDRGDRGREARAAYEALTDAVRRVAKVSSPTIVVAVG